MSDRKYVTLKRLFFKHKMAAMERIVYRSGFSRLSYHCCIAGVRR